ncbi:MAG: hypothetical protein IPO21_06240 [Bacteroidales bacterium]|nr:hypothetical protein [Bacteroidales bacterium]
MQINPSRPELYNKKYYEKLEIGGRGKCFDGLTVNILPSPRYSLGYKTKQTREFAILEEEKNGMKSANI